MMATGTNWPNLQLNNWLGTDYVLRAEVNTNFQKIDLAFHGSTGHKHDGTAGNGPKISYNDLKDKPSSFTPSLHAGSHKTGGSDPITPGDIGAETPNGAQAKVDAHSNITTAHGSTPSATAGSIMQRDINGQANVGAPTAASHIARKQDVDAAVVAAQIAQNKADSAFQSGSEFKTDVAAAITAKGVPTAASDTKQTFVNNISAIQTGPNTSDATAVSANILSGKTAYLADGTKHIGTMPNNGALNITPGPNPIPIPAGYTSGGTVAAASSILKPTGKFYERILPIARTSDDSKYYASVPISIVGPTDMVITGFVIDTAIDNGYNVKASGTVVSISAMGYAVDGYPPQTISATMSDPNHAYPDQFRMDLENVTITQDRVTATLKFSSPKDTLVLTVNSEVKLYITLLGYKK